MACGAAPARVDSHADNDQSRLGTFRDGLNLQTTGSVDARSKMIHSRRRGPEANGYAKEVIKFVVWGYGIEDTELRLLLGFLVRRGVPYRRAVEGGARASGKTWMLDERAKLRASANKHATQRR